MAFHQPTRQAAQRVFRPAIEDETPQRPQVAAVTQSLEESQTWVLFSPGTDAGTTASYLTSTHRSNITPGRSQSNDFGSLDTIAPSEASAGHQRSDSFIDAAEDEDDAELDSLDSHLPGFRSTPDFYISSEAVPHATPVLPAHDGLGLFRLEQAGMGEDVQNRLYAFEQYNPRRIKRRRESLDLAPAELESEENQEIEKVRRIESWRLEQSRYLLEEIQKETRRRRRSVASVSNTHHVGQRAEDTTLNSAGGTTEGNVDEDWHEQNLGDSSENRDSIWSRITRKVIQDLMGIDDKMLSILFGEALPNEEELSTTPKASALPSSNRDDTISRDAIPDSSWQVKMLERVAKELGLLVHQLSEHPGAFTTFSRIQQMAIPYAGLPAIPESTSYLVSNAAPHGEPTAMPEFQPTIPILKPIDIPQARAPSNSAHSKSPLQADNGTVFTQEEWEQDLDIRLVFRYLRSRFLPRSSGSGALSGTSHLAASTPGAQDVAAKAARVRQHHPLVSRARNVERRKSKSTTVSNPGLFRPASSCASQSTRRSLRRSSCSSSRHYWDIGGSVGTGSMIATTGPMGSWGEV
ncbi:hypothetical protein E0Z10_g2559 [Xylaria hypoxylon]|uniref:Uncharacterized protein n=1 Tax=Xylaria hypoxylon TaxID=37992 RepID=A0A4Z0ZC31_9PEZI|nr:hypothetical protein E0Z10_g2559 [Xylaria hypoxylon]